MQKEQFTPKPKDGLLYFHRMPGKGELLCLICNKEVEIIGFTHFADTGTSGYQCQGCGKHKTKRGPEGFKPNLICECGGELSRKEAVFCSNCRSTKVKYFMKLIT
jgi:hypothetical protein